jgi:sugar phosphate isomerase/epimerase
MEFNLNISTHSGDLEVIGHNWENARQLLVDEGFDGYELYPIGEYPWEDIPTGLIRGLHLRFFPIITPFWRGDYQRLLEIFGDKDTIKRFYGGTTPDALIEGYRRQLKLASQLGCSYVVFHLAQCEFEYMYDWNFPWNWQDTVNLCAELLHETFRDTPFNGELLLENLWWPGSFRALNTEEIAYSMERICLPRTGIMLDTGHILNTCQKITTEREGIRYLLDTVRSLGEMGNAIRGVHLTRSLSADYVIKSQSTMPAATSGSLWEYYHRAIKHVRQIDQHDAFEEPAMADLFDIINPDHVTYEFTYASRQEWLDKICRQRHAMASVHSRHGKCASDVVQSSKSIQS